MDVARRQARRARPAGAAIMAELYNDARGY
jgi:hypothetical protein